MKKLLMLLLVPFCLMFCACGGGNGGKEDEPEAGTFYTVTEAYEKGYLTREDVMSIAYYHNGGTDYNEEIMGENYTPLPKTPETLSAETKTAIMDDFYNSVFWECYEGYYSKDDIGCGYLGTYGSAIIVKVVVDGEGVDDVEWEEEIDGIIIYYRNAKRLTVWVADKKTNDVLNGNFYTVTEAYEKGYLSREQVLSIAYYHSEDYPYLDKDEKISDKNYKPLPLTPNQLAVKTQEAIKKTFINSIDANKESDNSEIISSLSYYGTYNDCIAVMIDSYIGYTGAEWTEKITDININYNSSNRIYIWRLN